ncbi:TPA: multidrug efflux RND transporter periplasmic adaptor subunit VmeJ [Vibrio parahaemolyticus]|uniref:multidrug efflux RND transporter periplasmic adaptor subunit VmeJ n=1 Tax=Vibrio parahaemolyticus TaxID=670 RepID=UPI00040B196F|nr:multidrug efflux RND transporter periplasmic adaptor subunit VmeJ [Vibrio parahaemolyticus]EKB7280992.1 multidrug efflux RND transporter periplasmic adaptor subunit VmeJ [Vibrio parahaemolyticus]EKB7282146.1 multidrug efflux RND transporter periplasmic adaptor subunit VmeJ [Vibrio parahaemolyticus]KJR18786.1 hemolysin D [Vibrio parahaemolyticus]MBE5195452.1 multidrug efflux RND transporter periplasmic adaptor subunit VmeJ [Vibrio parahaemolyticus]MDF4394408.1 multidrug efflux RND transporte
MSGTSFGRRFVERPWLVSLILILLLVAWLAAGQLKAQGDHTSSPSLQSENTPLAKVMFDTFTAKSTSKTIELYGRTAPNRQARLGAEVAGKIVSLNINKGQLVKQGQVIANIDKRDLDSQLKRAQAMLRVKEKEFNAAKSLKSRGLQGEVAFATAEAALVDARANLNNVQTALKNTEVKAPFDGIVDHHFVEVGDFVGVGDPIATVIDLETLVIEADVSERHIQYFKEGLQADVRTINGQHHLGTLRYIGRVSSVSTNTFPIEIEIDNRNSLIPAGISAEVQLPLNEVLAIKITAAMLALDEEGNLGVKTLQDEHVKFVPIQLVKAEEDGVWLSGLGEQADIIVLGQGFVRDGDTVIANKVGDVAADAAEK